MVQRSALRGARATFRAIAGGVLVAVFVLTGPSCAGGGKDSPTAPITPAPVIASIRITGIPQDDVVVIGASSTLSATPLDAAGTVVPGSVPTWSSSDTTILSVTSTGVVVGKTTGSAVVTASVGTITRAAALSVHSPITVPDSAAGTSQVSLFSGALSLTVPPGATGATKQINVGLSTAVLPKPATVVSPAYDFGPSGLQFATPIKVTIKYGTSGSSAILGSLVLATLGPGNTWVTVPGSVQDAVTKTVSAPVSHFSTYAVVIDSALAVRPGPVANMLIVAGQDQGSVVGKELPQALQVRVVDSVGRVIKGQLVNFRVVAGGGSVFAGAAITSDSGIAKERWTLGTSVSDSQRVEARAVDPVTGAGMVFGVFRAKPIADAPASLAKLQGDNQSVLAATTARDSLSVRVADRYGNSVPDVAVAWNVVAGGGAVSPASSVTSATGVARAQWTVGTRVDSAQLVTAKADPLPTISFAAAVLPAAASRMTLTRPAGGAASGSAFAQQPILTLVDSFGNVAKDATDSVTLSVGGGAVAVGGVTVAPKSGVASFVSAGVSGPVGNYLVGYGATLSGVPQSVTQTVALAAGNPRTLSLTTVAAGAASGAPFGTQPVVSVLDGAGNVVATSSATVTMTVSSGGSIVGTASVTAVNGVARFSSVGISGTIGTYTLGFSTGGLTSATQTVALTAGVATQLALTTSAAGTASGVAFTTQPVVAIRDGAGNTVTSDNSSIVTMTVSAGGTVVGTATATASGGVARFSTVGLSGPVGSYTLTFGASGFASATQSVALTAGVATQLALTTSAAGAASGAAFTTQPVVAIRDGVGNTVTSDNSSIVTMTVSAGGTVVGTATSTASGGVARFSTVGIAGTAGTSYTLTFAKTGLIPATQSITPTFGTASQVFLTTNAAGAASGAAFTTQPGVAIRDGAGNTVTSDNSSIVTVTVSTGGSVVGTATATASGGVARFSTVGLSGPVGSYTLTFGVSGLTSATQGIALSAGAATQLVLTTSAAGAASGAAFTTQPVVAIRDGAGNTVTSNNSSIVTMTVSAGGTVVGTATSTASGGVASFNTVGLSGPVGTYTVTFSTSGLTSATQSVALKAGATVAMILTPSTASIGVGGSQDLTAYFRDAAGNLTLIPGVLASNYAFATSDAAVVSIKNTAGATVTGVALGIATVTLTSDSGFSATATITVRGPTSLTWIGAIDKYWKNAGNWEPSSVPANGDRLVFPVGSQTSNNVEFSGTTGIESLTFMSGGITIDGPNVIPIRSLITNSESSPTLKAPIRLIGNVSIHTDCCGLRIESPIDLNSFNLNIDGYNTEVIGVIAGSGNVTLAQNTMSLRANNTYTGTTTVSTWAGIFGSQAQSDVTVTQGGSLFGGGSLGNLTVNGTLAPGTSSPCCSNTNGVGVFQVRDLVFHGDSGARYSRVDISGPLPGTGYDQVKATGTVRLGNATLDIAPLQSYIPPLGTIIKLIDNAGNGAVVGTFRGLPEGATVTLNSAFSFRISYVGGDGNDVTLTRIG